MDTITLEAALEIARREIDLLAAAAGGGTFELLPEATMDVGRGWLFFYNSSEFVRSGNPSDQLAGNGPVFVMRDGRVHRLPSWVSWEQALKQI